MKKSELRHMIREEIEKLNEYFIRPGDKVDDLFVYNLFSDMLPGSESIDKHADEDMVNGIRTTIKKYRPIAIKLSKIMKKFKKENIPVEYAKDADNYMYDGSDAYDDADEYNDYLPGIFDAQIDFIESVLAELGG